MPLRIQIVDERVRNLTVNRLKGLGYRVHSTADGSAAVRLLEEGLVPDLVFSDVVMPGGLSGHDVVRRAKELNPEIKVLLTSGYAEDLARSEDLGEVKLLRKPYRLSDLRSALKDALGS